MTFKRLPEGGMIDRNVKLSARLDGVRVHGFGGDTFASALLAANKIVLGRSFTLRSIIPPSGKRLNVIAPPPEFHWWRCRVSV